MAGIISVEQTAFLKFELEHGTPRRKKAALQDVSRLYRNGQVLKPENRQIFEQLINGMVLSHQDGKVVRWCLNALAQFGTRTGSTKYVEHALRANEGNPEIVAAAVAALARMYNGQIQEVEALRNTDPVIRLLAAMQVTDPAKLDLTNVKINIDTADPEVLKLALITVGLNRDIQNLFNPRHPNGQIIKALGDYPDDIVRQYCVWCVLENQKLSLADLGIPFSSFEAQPPNVQAKLLQLGAEKIPDLKDRHALIHKGSYASTPEARCGLAKGLLRNYHDGLEEITIGWFDTEADTEVKAHLAEHMARFSDDCPPYVAKSQAIVEQEPDFKERILLGAEQTNLYGIIKREAANNGTLEMFPEQSELHHMFRGPKKVKNMKSLMLAAAPVNQERLRLDEEARDLTEQLALVKGPAVDVVVEHRWAVRTNQLQREVMESKPQVLHFSGHGDADMLIFEDAVGQAAVVSAEAIAELVELHPSIDCLLLNACYSESVARLVAPHVKAVIGCNSSIADAAAIAFSRSFYRALAHGETYERAFKLAVNEVRISSGSEEADRYVILK